jgi:hypothetical protein
LNCATNTGPNKLLTLLCDWEKYMPTPKWLMTPRHWRRFGPDCRQCQRIKNKTIERKYLRLTEPVFSATHLTGKDCDRKTESKNARASS